MQKVFYFVKEARGGYVIIFEMYIVIFEMPFMTF